MNSQAPGWFHDAINAPYEDHWLDVKGCRIHYQVWDDDKTKPGLLLVHGHGAHAHWWDFIAPLLGDHYRIAALDVSGAGDSGHRNQYTSRLFVEEVVSVYNEVGFGPDDIMVGHSFGGRTTRLAGFHYPELMAGVVLVDSAIPLPGVHSNFRIPPATSKPTRYYPSRAEAARRFRLRPPQPCANKFAIDHIASHSVKETREGWCWKLDPLVFSKMLDLDASGQDAGTMIKNLKCQTGIIYGDNSRFFGSETRDYVSSLLPAENLRSVTDAYHHLFLDQPLAFLAALRDLLNGWNQSDSM